MTRSSGQRTGAEAPSNKLPIALQTEALPPLPPNHLTNREFLAKRIGCLKARNSGTESLHRGDRLFFDCREREFDKVGNAPSRTYCLDLGCPRRPTTVTVYP